MYCSFKDVLSLDYEVVLTKDTTRRIVEGAPNATVSDMVTVPTISMIYTIHMNRSDLLTNIMSTSSFLHFFWYWKESSNTEL